MNMVIVGHGASLARRHLGEQIDRFDFICKVKRGMSREKEYLETPENAGAKCNAVAAPLRPKLKGLDISGCSEVWLVRLVKHRLGDHSRWWQDLAQLERRSPLVLRQAYTALTYWGARYQAEAPENGPSTGLEAIVVALEMYRPPSITLAGFDAIETGERSQWAEKLGKDPHPAWIEKKMLAEMERFYQCRVRFL